MFRRIPSSTLRLFMAVSLMPLACGASVTHAADLRHGEEVFAQECAECHSVREGKNKKGPSLSAVAGRKAASVADFVYSDAMKQSGIVWAPAALDAYVANPRKAVPGGKMKYDGLADTHDREDLIAYLGTLK